MKNKRYILPFLIIILLEIIYSPLHAQQKNDTHRANFSGEWKSKEPITMGGNIVCAYIVGDRMNAKSMKITQQADFLNIATPNSTNGKKFSGNQEQLAFDGKETEMKQGDGIGKKFTVKWSDDGQNITINTVVHMKEVIHYVQEVWNLSKDTKTITVQANAKSNVWGETRSWKTVFDKTN
jgi:hypothetical protein